MYIHIFHSGYMCSSTSLPTCNHPRYNTKFRMHITSKSIFVYFNSEVLTEKLRKQKGLEWILTWISWFKPTFILFLNIFVLYRNFHVLKFLVLSHLLSKQQEVKIKVYNLEQPWQTFDIRFQPYFTNWKRLPVQSVGRRPTHLLGTIWPTSLIISVLSSPNIKFLVNELLLYSFTIKITPINDPSYNIRS